MKYRLYQGPGYEPKRLAELTSETPDDFEGLKLVAARMNGQPGVEFHHLEGAEPYSILKVWDTLS